MLNKPHKAPEESLNRPVEKEPVISPSAANEVSNKVNAELNSIEQHHRLSPLEQQMVESKTLDDEIGKVKRLLKQMDTVAFRHNLDSIDDATRNRINSCSNSLKSYFDELKELRLGQLNNKREELLEVQKQAQNKSFNLNESYATLFKESTTKLMMTKQLNDLEAEGRRTLHEVRQAIKTENRAKTELAAINEAIDNLNDEKATTAKVLNKYYASLDTTTDLLIDAEKNFTSFIKHLDKIRRRYDFPIPERPSELEDLLSR